MTLDEIMLWMLLFAAAMFLCAMAILIYACALLLHVHQKIKAFENPGVERNGDWNERKRQERV